MLTISGFVKGLVLPNNEYEEKIKEEISDAEKELEYLCDLKKLEKLLLRFNDLAKFWELKYDFELSQLSNYNTSQLNWLQRNYHDFQVACFNLTTKQIHERAVAVFDTVNEKILEYCNEECRTRFHIDISENPEFSNFISTVSTGTFYSLLKKIVVDQEKLDALNKELGDPFLTFIYLVLLVSKDDSAILKSIPADTYDLLLRKLFYSPHLFKEINAIFFKLETLSIRDEGDGEISCPQLTRIILKKLESCLMTEESKTASLLREFIQSQANALGEPLIISKTFRGNFVFEKILGRTLIFKEGDRRLAIKLQKKDESIDALWQEHHMLTFFREGPFKDHLQSIWPNPLGVHKVCEISEEISSRIPLALHEADLHAYLYEFQGDDYFHYLHEKGISEELFQKARFAALHDLFFLAKHHVIFAALADLFHSQEVLKKGWIMVASWL